MTELWPWAVAAYARPGVADACLQLQDEQGQNVPLLLWALWSAETGARPDLSAGARIAHVWEEAAVAPLRRIRRGLKAPAPPLTDTDREAVREGVKALELDAERRVLLALAVVPQAPGAAPPSSVLLSAAATAWGAPLPPGAFDDLLRRLNPGPA